MYLGGAGRSNLKRLKIMPMSRNLGIKHNSLICDKKVDKALPPPAIVALISKSNSSSPRIANCKCLGDIRFTFKSFDALPANSSTSAVKYSKIAAL